MDMVDLVVFHAVCELAQWEELAAPGGGMEQLGQIVGSGRGRFRGISSHHPDVLREAIKSGELVVLAEDCMVRRQFVYRLSPPVSGRP